MRSVGRASGATVSLCQSRPFVSFQLGTRPFNTQELREHASVLWSLPAPSKCPSSQCSSSPAVPSRGAPGGSGQRGTPRARPQPLSAQPPPQVLELAA